VGCGSSPVQSSPVWSHEEAPERTVELPVNRNTERDQLVTGVHNPEPVSTGNAQYFFKFQCVQEVTNW
jgi:hypothetical protein